MAIERPQALFAPPIDAGSQRASDEENISNLVTALQEQAQPEVHDLVSILYATYTLQRSLEDAASERSNQQRVAPVPSQSVEHYGSQLNGIPSFTERYRRASIFVAAAVHILRGSFTAYPEDPEYSRATLDAAFNPYGFMVADGKGEYHVENSAYHDIVEQQQERYKQSRAGTVIPRSHLSFVVDDNSQWEPAGLWEEEPEVVKFTEELNKIRAIEKHLFEKNVAERGSLYWDRDFRSEEKADHIPGLHPFYRERYSRAAFILRSTAEGVMMDGRQGDSFSWLHSLTYSFNEALYDLDMHIDINPTWEPAQAPADLPIENITKIEEVTE